MFILLHSLQQGDPLGPVLFALAIHPVIVEARAATEAMYPGGIDICSFFLDDGFCAGSAPAVQHFLSALVRGFRRIGLVVNLDKTEVILASPSSQSFAPGDFQGCTWIGSSNFKLLGAPLGSMEWCEDLLGRRIRKARALSAAIGKFPDAQGAFCLLRSCSGWSKVIFSCRTVPPDAQQKGLHTADHDVRSALCHLTGRPLSDDDSRLASLGITAGRLGGRCAAEHAPAAYVVSFSACRDLYSLLWADSDPLDLEDGCHLAAAEDSLRSVIPFGANIYASPSQKSLSCKVEAQSVSRIFADPVLPRHRRLHLDACSVRGAGAWLTANPSSADSRLRMPHWDHDSACSMCGEVLDRWGDHALSCGCGGDWILRHNAIRDVVCSAVSEFTSSTVADVFHEVDARKCAFQGTAASVAESGATFVRCPRPFGRS